MSVRLARACCLWFTAVALATTALLRPAPAFALPLTPEEASVLSDWYSVVQPKRPHETFGALVHRVALTRLGRPYDDTPWANTPEALICRVSSFECVSYVEGVLAVSRCLWASTPDETCFLNQVQLMRYRDGVIDGYPSRLHYYEDWLTDNVHKNTLQMLTEQLGGVPHDVTYFYMSHHTTRFPPLVDPNNVRSILGVEERLSRTPVVYIERDALPDIYSRLRDGDIIAIASSERGLCVTHTGFVHFGSDKLPHLLHASSAHHHVMVSPNALGEYMQQQPKRLGVLVARPLPPKRDAAPLKAKTKSRARR